MADFLNEFYQPDSAKSVKVVILSCSEKSNEISSKIAELEFENKVTNKVSYFQGSAIRAHDLERVEAKNAEAAFILTTRNAANREAEDQRTIMRAMHIHSYAPNIKVYVHVLKIKSKLHVDFADQILCDEELSHAMFSLNCRIPGCSTAMALLCHTTQGEPDEDMLEWQKQINNSVDFEIYDQPVHSSIIFKKYVGMEFAKASYLCHKTYSVSLIAISRNQDIMINPIVTIQTSDIVFYISGVEESKLDKDFAALEKMAASRKSIVHGLSSLHENSDVSYVSNIDETYQQYDIDSMEQMNLQNGRGASVKPFEQQKNAATINFGNKEFITDFPPFCPVIERTSLHVICYLNNNPTQDIVAIKEKTQLKLDVFGGRKLSNQKPIIIISTRKLGLERSIFKGILGFFCCVIFIKFLAFGPR